MSDQQICEWPRKLLLGMDCACRTGYYNLLNCRQEGHNVPDRIGTFNNSTPFLPLETGSAPKCLSSHHQLAKSNKSVAPKMMIFFHSISIQHE